MTAGQSEQVSPADERSEDVLLATLADLGVTTNRGPQWPEDDVEDALWGSGVIGWEDTHPDATTIAVAVSEAADQLYAKVESGLPPGLRLVDDKVWGPPDTDLAALAQDAVRWKERAAFAEIVAETGIWSPPSISEAPEVRIEGRADVPIPGGHVASHLVPQAAATYWGVYGVDPEGLVHWEADFADLETARRHADRWQRPGSIICSDLIEVLPGPDPAKVHQPDLGPGTGEGATRELRTPQDVLDVAALFTREQANSLAEAYLRGGGVPWARPDPHAYRARKAATRALITDKLPRFWAYTMDENRAANTTADHGRFAARIAVKNTLLALHAHPLIDPSAGRRGWTPEAYDQLTAAWVAAIGPVPEPPPPRQPGFDFGPAPERHPPVDPLATTPERPVGQPAPVTSSAHVR